MRPTPLRPAVERSRSSRFLALWGESDADVPGLKTWTSASRSPFCRAAPHSGDHSGGATPVPIRHVTSSFFPSSVHASLPRLAPAPSDRLHLWRPCLLMIAIIPSRPPGATGQPPAIWRPSSSRNGWCPAGGIRVEHEQPLRLFLILDSRTTNANDRPSEDQRIRRSVRSTGASGRMISPLSRFQKCSREFWPPLLSVTKERILLWGH